MTRLQSGCTIQFLIENLVKTKKSIKRRRSYSCNVWPNTKRGSIVVKEGSQHSLIYFGELEEDQQSCCRSSRSSLLKRIRGCSGVSRMFEDLCSCRQDALPFLRLSDLRPRLVGADDLVFYFGTTRATFTPHIEKAWKFKVPTCLIASAEPSRNLSSLFPHFLFQSIFCSVPVDSSYWCFRR